MLQAVIPDSAATILNGGSDTYNYSLTAEDYSVYAYDTATVNVLTSGSIGDDLQAWDNSKVTVSGGTLDDLKALDNGTLTIIGTFDSFAYDDYTDGDSLDGQLLTGELLDGTDISNQVHIYESATVTLQAIPEPSCFALFGIGACGLVLVRRRRTATQRSPA